MTGTPPLAMCLRSLRAVVFDTDGVVIDSAGLHAAAWKTAFDACLTAMGGHRADHGRQGPSGRGGGPDLRPFDPVDDYLRHVDGLSRQDGAAAFLASRGIDLPRGDPGDAPGTDTVGAVAARKEKAFTAGLREHGVPAFPGTVRLLGALRAAGTRCAAVSASRHATDLLTAADVRALFDAVVDGAEAARLQLPGKPDPALFLEAARRLGTPVEDTAVVEDALAGAEAGRRGGFGLVVGVDRSGTGAAALRRAGADVVVTDPGELLTTGSP